MFSISTVRGWNADRVFWASAIAYTILLIVFFLLSLLSGIASLYDASVVLLILAYLTIGVGILIAPFVNLAIRLRYHDLFKKPMQSHIRQPSNDSISPRSEPAAQKHQSSHLETNALIQSEPVPAPVTKPKTEEKQSHIFVSYRRSDSADIAGRIYDRLIGKFGKGPIFKDVDSIPLGLDFKEYLDMKVGECDVFLAIIGGEWLTASDAAGNRRIDDPTDFVRIEIESALQRKIPVIPLLVRDARMPREADLPASLHKLAYRNGTPIRSDPDFHRDMDRLIAALEKYVKKDESS